MLKKILIQIFLIIIIIVILVLFYSKYISKEDQTKSNNKEISELEITKGSVISNINYESKDFEGRKYLIKSQKGILNKDNPDLIEMENVYANITLIDGTNITIKSDYAIYDNIKFNTKFKQNLKVKYLDHTIKSDNLILSFERNKLEAFNNLTYENSDLIMFADKIIFDFKLKNTKIFNYDNTNIKIQNK